MVIAITNNKLFNPENKSWHPGGCVQSPWNSQIYYNNESEGKTQYNSWVESSENSNFNIYCKTQQ